MLFPVATHGSQVGIVVVAVHAKSLKSAELSELLSLN